MPCGSKTNSAIVTSACSIPTRLLAGNSMKRGFVILSLGLLAAALGYCCVYVTATSSARRLQKSDQPELAWLKQEFNLSDAEFKRVSELHAASLPTCHELCRQIDRQP